MPISDSRIDANGFGVAMPRWKSTKSEKRRPVSALETAGRHQFSSVCVWISLISSIRHLLKRMEAGAVTVVCVAPAGTDPALYEVAWDALCRKLAWNLGDPRSVSGKGFVFPADKASAIGLSTDERWCAGFASDVSDVPASFASYAEEVISIRPITARDMQAAARLTIGFELESTEISGIITSNLPSYDHIFQMGRKRAQVAKAIRLVTESHGKKSATRGKETLTLDELPGMGAATVWAKEVIQDLEDWKAGKINWADVDRGIVLYGPPGTGKSSFARAMAGSAKIPLIAGSIAKWQSSGHLGDMLKSMRSAFASAARQAPSVLLIDEIDVVGDRAKFVSQHRDYDNKVVAALLELLDGAEAREGVVVVGTSNFHPVDVLDPALIRPGRLEAWIEIPMPDRAARLEILRRHGATIPDGELARIAERTEGRTGADLEALVRVAKRIARRASRAQSFDDYLLALPGVHPLPEEIVRRMAVHECGHGLAAVVLGHGRLNSIRILREIASDAGQIAAGRTRFEASPFSSRSRSEIQDEIVVMLAGMAAEELVYGDWTEGSGLSESSDLGRATSLALYMSGTLGMSGSLARVVDDPAKIRTVDSGLRRSVDDVLAVCMERARTIVRDSKDALMRMSEVLIAESELTLSTIRSIIDGDIPPEVFSDRH